MIYLKLTNRQLLTEFDLEKKNWKCLPRKSSFSGLEVSERLEKIQQEMARRNINFNPVYMNINMFG